MQPIKFVGYIKKLNTGSTIEKTVRFKVLNRKETKIDYFPIHPYESLPCYNPLVVYTLLCVKMDMMDTSMFQVCRVLSCRRRFPEGIPKQLLEKHLPKQHRYLLSKFDLPLFIRSKRDIQLIKDEGGKVRKFIMKLCMPWFRGTSYFDLMRYFTSSWLCQFSDIELDYLLAVAIYMPATFCFRNRIEHYTNTKIVFNTTNLFTNRKPITIPLDYIREVGKFFLDEKSLMRFHHSTPIWTISIMKNFMLDHHIEIDQCWLDTATLSLRAFLRFEMERYRNGSTSFPTKDKNEITTSIQVFLTSHGVMVHSGENELCYPQSQLLHLTLVKRILCERSKLFVFDLNCMEKEYYSILSSAIGSLIDRTVLVCCSVSQREAAKKATGGLCETIHSMEHKSFAPIKRIVLLSVHRMDVALIVKLLQSVPKRMSICLVGSSHDTNNSCGSHFADLSGMKNCTLVDRVQKGTAFDNIVKRNLPKLTKCIYPTKTMAYKSFLKWEEGMKKSARGKSKEEKRISKQFFCSTEKTKTAVMEIMLAKINCSYTPGTLYVDKKVCVYDIGFCGTIESAKRRLPSGNWIDVKQKRPILPEIYEYQLVITHSETKFSLTISTKNYKCGIAEIELIDKYPEQRIQYGVFFVDEKTNSNELMRAAKLCDIDLFVYTEKEFPLGSVYDKNKRANSSLGRILEMFET